MPLGPVEILAICAGALVLLAGGWMLFGLRPKKPRTDADSGLSLNAQQVPSGPRAFRMSESTRIAFSLLLIIAGYHLIVWQFHQNWVGVQLRREWWWMWVLIGLGLALLSHAMDRMEERGGGDGRGSAGGA